MCEGLTICKPTIAEYLAGRIMPGCAILFLGFLCCCGSGSGLNSMLARTLVAVGSPIGAGYVVRNPDQTSFTDGTLVKLTATSTSGWIFDHWEGDLSGNANPTSLKMDAERQVTAVFAAAPLDMVAVAGGTFQMGLTDQQLALPVHSVSVSSFLIGRQEVTQAQYRAVMGVNPSCYEGDDSRRVEWVKWLDSVAFCNELSQREGLQPCYTILYDTTSCDFATNGYRLPTEAEWEFAARGGTSSQGFIYSGSSSPGDVAWYGEAPFQTHPVGMKAPNELGIYDMSGNVEEWCWDWLGVYSSGAQTDPTGPDYGLYHVVRGGSVYSRTDYIRPGYRESCDTGSSISTLGFRVVRRAN